MKDDLEVPRFGALFSYGSGFGHALEKRQDKRELEILNAEAYILVAVIDLMVRGEVTAALNILRTYESLFGRPSKRDGQQAVQAYQDQLRQKIKRMDARHCTGRFRGRPRIWTSKRRAQLLADYSAERESWTGLEEPSDRLIARRLLKKEPWRRLLENSKDPTGALTRQLRDARTESEEPRLRALLEGVSRFDPSRLRENTE